MFRIDFDATHDFDKLFSKGKVNQYKFGFELDSLLVRMQDNVSYDLFELGCNRVSENNNG